MAEWRKVKEFCEAGIGRGTNVCIDPRTDERLRIIEAGKIQAYQSILNLEQGNNTLNQFKGETG